MTCKNYENFFKQRKPLTVIIMLKNNTQSPVQENGDGAGLAPGNGVSSKLRLRLTCSKGKVSFNF